MRYGADAMTSDRARLGGELESPPTRIAAALDLPAEVRALAEHLQHAAQLALLAAAGPDPEHGAEYMLDTLADLQPRFVALRGRVIPA